MNEAIKHRATGVIIVEAGKYADVREAAEKNKAYLGGADLRGADLRGAYLGGADLRGAYLRDAYLRGADLRGAYLRGADLRGADLGGAYLRDAYLGGAYLGGAEPATPKEAIANLDKVREIILDNHKLLHMGHWHDNQEWCAHTCAEEAVCGTTHCLAGWLQVCSTDEKIRKLADVQLAGILSAPIASHLFFESESKVMGWLKDRKYAEEAA